LARGTCESIRARPIRSKVQFRTVAGAAAALTSRPVSHARSARAASAANPNVATSEKPADAWCKSTAEVPAQATAIAAASDPPGAARPPAATGAHGPAIAPANAGTHQRSAPCQVAGTTKAAITPAAVPLSN